jgi:PAS domain S-box-containing protein
MPEAPLTIDFLHLFETLPGLYVVLNPELKVIAVTDEYLRATFARREDLMGRYLFDIFPDNPEDGGSHSSKDVKGSLEKVFATGQPDELPLIKYDVRQPKESGGGFTEKHWRLVTFPGFDAGRKVTHVIHRVEDVTERKLTEEILRESERRLKFTLAAGQLGSYEYYPLSGKMFFSERCLANFGLSPDADFSFEKMLSMIDAGDRESVRKTFESSIENRADYKIEYKITRADGEPGWIYASGRCLYDDEGNPLVMNGVTLDITSRRQAEEELRRSQERLELAIDASRLGLWYCDLPFDVLDWSDLTKGHFWLPPNATVTIDDFYEIIHPEDREKTKSAIDASIEKRSVYDIVYRTVNPQNNHIKWIRAIGRGFYDERGEPYRFDGVTIDITENKLIESEREQLLWSEKKARAEAEQANRMKDEFLATLSHELRTPLSSILGWSRLLKDGKIPNEQMSRAIETIERNAKAQSQLIEDILDVSRITSGKLRLDVRPVELDAVIEMAIESVRPAADAKNIRLQKIIDSNAIVSGDPDRLQQVVWNLLSNSIKFTPKDGRVQIRLERINSHIGITVEDNGIGIDAETLPFIFERFRQSDSSTTRKYGGLGLGLAIVRHLVELHGGTIQAESLGLNKGAVFTVMLPVTIIQSNEATFRKEMETGRIYPAGGDVVIICPEEVKNLRVLLVDDEPDTRTMLEYIFTNCGAIVNSASSTEEAFEVFKSNNFDILISDIGMPERDGYELIQKIRQLAPENGGRIPAVALTAYARIEDRLRILSSGFQMHVTKPIEPAELLTVVASLANRNNHK